MAILVAFVFAVVATASVRSLTCNEGFNVSIAGVPLYHWEERTCADKSECFMQELRSEIYNTGLEIGASYGGCISSSYSRIITCPTLFGENSTLDPAVLVNMVPDFVHKMQNFSLGFYGYNGSEHIKEFFSNGKGRDEFIAGCYRFLENLGFNTEKARPLQKPITDLLEAILSYSLGTDYSSYSVGINNAIDNILAALGQLDTKNSDIAENLYAFFDNWIYSEIRGTKYAPLVENLPELIRSALPTNLKPELWFDAVFEIMGDFDSDEPTQISKDMVQTIKTYWDMPKSEERYINLILDSIPGFVDLLETGEGDEWLAVLQRSSTKNTETGRLAAAVKRIIRTFYKEYSYLSQNVKSAIEWLPGIAYYLFPDETTEIDRVYNVLSDGLEATDFSNPTDTMERTNMSDFILSITEKTGLFYQIVKGRKESKQMNDLVIINAAKTVYNLIPEYTDQLDTVFSALLKISEDYPYFNATNLILNLGVEVPKGMKPILDNVQNVLRTIYNETGMNFRPEEFLKQIRKIITEYKDMYPDSELPIIAERYLNYTYKVNNDYPRFSDCTPVNDWWNETEVQAYYNCTNAYYAKVSEFYRQLSEESMNISVDLQFAIFKALDYTGNPVFKALIDAFPDLELYFKAMRLLDPSDVKDLFAEYINWLYESMNQPTTVESLFRMINSTMSKVMKKLDEVVKEMRILFSPDSCEYMSCGDDLCNTRDVLKTKETFTRDPSKRKFGQLPTRPTVAYKDETTTSKKIEKKNVYYPTMYGNLNGTLGSSSGRKNPTLLLNTLAVLILAKFFAQVSQ